MNNLIIDGFALAFRSHFSHSTLRTATGLFSGCLYGFLTTMGSVKKKHRDFHITVAWDLEATRKKTAFPDYKCNRSKFSIDEQIHDIKELLRNLNVTQSECVGEEADDVIATLVAQYTPEGKVYILSNDKDLTQLVKNGKVIILCPVKGGGFTFFDEEAVKNQFGVKPQNIACYLALRGDTIDSIPGLPRVRSTIIADLVEKYNTPQAVYAHLSEESLTDNERTAFTNFEKQVQVNYTLTKLVDTLQLSTAKGISNPIAVQSLLDKYEIRKIKAESYSENFLEEGSFSYRTAPQFVMDSLFD
jgi:DNA polymerase I